MSNTSPDNDYPFPPELEAIAGEEGESNIIQTLSAWPVDLVLAVCYKALDPKDHRHALLEQYQSLEEQIQKITELERKLQDMMLRRLGLQRQRLLEPIITDVEESYGTLGGYTPRGGGIKGIGPLVTGAQQFIELVKADRRETIYPTEAQVEALIALAKHDPKRFKEISEKVIKNIGEQQFASILAAIGLVFQLGDLLVGRLGILELGNATAVFSGLEQTEQSIIDGLANIVQTYINWHPNTDFIQPLVALLSAGSFYLLLSASGRRKALISGASVELAQQASQDVLDKLLSRLENERILARKIMGEPVLLPTLPTLPTETGKKRGEKPSVEDGVLNNGIYRIFAFTYDVTENGKGKGELTPVAIEYDPHKKEYFVRVPRDMPTQIMFGVGIANGVEIDMDNSETIPSVSAISDGKLLATQTADDSIRVMPGAYPFDQTRMTQHERDLSRQMLLAAGEKVNYEAGMAVIAGNRNITAGDRRTTATLTPFLTLPSRQRVLGDPVTIVGQRFIKTEGGYHQAISSVSVHIYSLSHTPRRHIFRK